MSSDSYLRALTRSYYDIQDQRIRSQHRLRGLPPAHSAFIQERVIDQFGGTEATLRAEIVRELNQWPVWTEFLEKVNGVGPCSAGSMLGEIGNISRFDTPSALWSYCGYAVGFVISECSEGHKMVSATFPKYPCPVLKKDKKGKVIVESSTKEGEGKKEPKRCGAEFKLVSEHPGERIRRVSGCRCSWNTFLQTRLWNLGGNFVRSGGVYRELYDKVKEGITRDHPELSKGHIDSRARRKTVKIFLCGMWERWRELEGLPVRAPYVIEKLGHTSYVPPMTDKD